jgi:hypothetical protein
MQRREFIKTVSAVASTFALGACTDSNDAAVVAQDSAKTTGKTYPLDSLFPRYTEFDPKVPVWCVTPDVDHCIHRFHLSSPVSPSGRYLGLTSLPREDRPPEPGDAAGIVLVDLETGEQKVIAETIGWDTQLGAQVQWGATDEELFFNDVDPTTWMPFGVKMNPATGAAGYGVIVPKETVPVNKGVVDDDGVYVTNTQTGESQMVASYKKIIDEAIPKIDVSRYGPGDFYGFHVKWNAQSDRIMLVLRYMPYNVKQRKPMLITMTRSGEDIRVAIPASEWADKGGNHPNWHPDGEHVIMNLDIEALDPDREDWRYVKARYDGTGLTEFTSVPANHGHPSIHPGGRYMISDVYPREADAFGDGTVPLHFIDLEKHERQTLLRMDSVSRFFDDDMNTAKEMRVDLHPAWDRSAYTRAVINGVLDGTRRVFVVDLSEVMG